MNSPIMYIKKLIRKESRADSFCCRKAADRSCIQPRERVRVRGAQTYIKHQSLDSTRESVLITKKDSETFGFEIRTYDEKISNNSDEETLTCVCKVNENSPAEKAGLRTGDVIISVNSVWVEGFEHQQIVDLVQTSCLLKMEVLRGTTVKQRELQKKLHHLQWQLNQKWEELQMLIVQQELLLRGGLRSTQDSCPDLEHPTIPIPS